MRWGEGGIWSWVGESVEGLGIGLIVEIRGERVCCWDGLKRVRRLWMIG